MPGRPSRRTLLRTIGAGAVLAGTGCLGDASTTTEDTSTETTTNTPPTTTSADTPATTIPSDPVEEVAVTQSFVYRFASAHTRAVTAPEDLFVFATLTDVGVDPEAVRLTVGGERYAPADELHGVDVSATTRQIESERQGIAFSLPRAPTDHDATITVGETVAQRLPASARERIAAPPALRFDGASVASVGDMASTRRSASR
ncbi:MAG: hypothetical protein ABEJ59_01490 [Halanaeroarchaeum sp.]